MTTLNTYQAIIVTVPFGQEETINVSGSFISCLSSTAPSFPIGVDGAARQFMQAGLTFTTPAGERFTSITVSAVGLESGTLTVRLAIGDGDIRDARLSSQGLLLARATSLSIADSNIAPLAAGGHRLIVSPSDYDQRIFIKADPLNLQELRLSNSIVLTSGYRLYPGEEIILRVRSTDGTTGWVYAFNPAVAEANYYTMIEVIGLPDPGIPV
jgi:hypothetical protein